MTEMVYVATHPICGSIVVAVIDWPQHKKETARSVADCVRRGLEVDRIAREDVKAMRFCRCPRVNGKLQHVAPSEVTA